MATQTATHSFDDQEYYLLHEEDDVPEIPDHEAQVRYVRDALDGHLSGCFVTVCIFWERGNLRDYTAEVQAAEYLYTDPPRDGLRLWRLDENGYETVKPEPNGRLRSPELGLEFGLDEYGLLQVYTLEGERLLDYQEEVQRRREAEQRLTEEARQRQDGEQRARESEARAASEAAQRVELERQLAVLRAQLGGQQTGSEE